MYVNQAMTLNIEDKNNHVIVSYWKYLDDIAQEHRKAFPKKSLTIPPIHR